MWDPTVGRYVSFKLELIEIMLVCSILVSSDIIAAMSILKFEEFPHIFSIILGEGLFNDVVVIVLYETVKSYQEDSTLVFTGSTVFSIIGDFINLCFWSVAVGMDFGFAVTYVLKRIRAVSHSAIHETFMLLASAMLCYYSSELMG